MKSDNQLRVGKNWYKKKVNDDNFAKNTENTDTNDTTKELKFSLARLTVKKM